MKLRVGVFGTGHLGKFHLNNWREISSAELVGFYEPNDETAEEVVQNYGLRRYLTPAELLTDIDVADIVAPTDHHFEMCALAVKAGKHIFVEKPFAHTLEEGRALLAMIKEANVKVQVGHVERFNPAFVAAKKMELNPMFIEVHRLAQFNPRGTEVSVILDLMIHDIDIILNLVKSGIHHISASGVCVLTDTPDIANVRIEFNNGCVANLTASRISMKKMRKMRLFQKDAYVGIDFLTKKTEIIKMAGEHEIPGAFTFDIDTPNGGKKAISIINPEVNEYNAIKEELSAFIHSIMDKKPVIVSAVDGYLAMDVAHQILEKMNNTVGLSVH